MKTFEQFMGEIKTKIETNSTVNPNEIKSWHKDSSPLTKNVDGSPKVFYHGTNADFDSFEMGHTARDGGYKTSNAIAFTTDKNYAESYGKNIKKVYLYAKNVLDLTSLSVGQKLKLNVRELNAETVARLQSMGYDAIKGLRTKDEIAVFTPRSQIKNVY